MYNRFHPTSRRENQTAYEVRFKRSCPHTKLAVPFGCEAIVHKKGHLQKFEPRAIKCIVIGLVGNLDAYELLDLDYFVETRGQSRLIISRDVKTRADSFPLRSPDYQTAMRVWEIDLDDDSAARCPKCKLTVTRMRVTCVSCVDSRGGRARAQLENSRILLSRILAQPKCQSSTYLPKVTIELTTR